jgi:2-deoxy-D-gluconate 3-dehydrogenase
MLSVEGESDMSFFDLTGKVVLVTGGAGGIGNAVALGFLEHNARVAVVDKTPYVKRGADGRANDEAILGICADLTDVGQILGAVNKVSESFGEIDVLVNAHGVNIRKELDDYTMAEWDLIHQVNLTSVFEMSRVVARIMRARGYGRIINISSMQATICWNGNGDFSLAPYCSSKAGVVAITKAMALELASFGVTVNSVCPGFVDTPLVAPLKNNPALYEDIIARTPVGRFASTDEIVAPVLFLATSLSSYITGQAILVDGGWTIQ